MKLRAAAVTAALAMVLSTFSGCGLIAAEARLDAAEDAFEHRMDEVEQKAESALQSAIAPERTGPAKNAGNALLTVEEAQRIAVEHAGVNTGDVTHLYTEYENDDGVSRYEVQFQNGRTEYEYEIHADTGEILSFEKDKD